MAARSVTVIFAIVISIIPIDSVVALRTLPVIMIGRAVIDMAGNTVEITSVVETDLSPVISDVAGRTLSGVVVWGRIG